MLVTAIMHIINSTFGAIVLNAWEAADLGPNVYVSKIIVTKGCKSKFVSYLQFQLWELKKDSDARTGEDLEHWMRNGSGTSYVKEVEQKISSSFRQGGWFFIDKKNTKLPQNVRGV